MIIVSADGHIGDPAELARGFETASEKSYNRPRFDRLSVVANALTSSYKYF